MAKRLFLVALSMAAVVFNSTNAEVPAIFIFGDSTADVGTNSFLPGSEARADFPHNGIDFPHSRPTGRFSNGFNSADFLAKLMGFKRSPPPFLSLNGSISVRKRSFRGANFASGGSGLLDITGQTMLAYMKPGEDKNLNNVSQINQNVVPMSEQITQFSMIHDDLIAIKGEAETGELLRKSLFFISTGSNDIFSYHRSGSTIPKQEFISTLGRAYEKYLRSLLSLGARKFGIISVPSIGCCPSQRIQNATAGCLEELNELARAFHSTMGALMSRLSAEYKDMKYSVGNAYEMTMNVIQNPLPFNFKDVKSACCGNGTLNAESFCDPEAKLCLNRNEYLFWDLFHPTQAASNLAALTLYGGEEKFVAPINFSQLAKA